MIKNRVVFEDVYPTQILHRNAELDSLSRLLEPAQYGRPAKNALIHGPSGVGKTASARWMLRDLRQREGVNSALIECSGETRNGILHEAIEKYPKGTVVHRNQPHDELLEMFRKIVDEPFIIALDEADVIPDLDALGDLLSVDEVSVIAITHSEDEWLNRVDRNLRSQFHGDRQIEYRKYRVPELVDILEPRVEHGLIGNPISIGQLEWIADETGGVARYAIKSVLAAAEIAMDRDHETIRENDVRDSFDRAKRMIRKANLRSLPVTHLRLYELLRAVGPTGTELKDVYHEHKEAIFEGEQREPAAWRQAWNYLSKMADYGLVRMPGETNSKVYEVVDPELEAPVEFEIVETV